MTEEFFKSIRKIKCVCCGKVVLAVPSPFVASVRKQGGVELQALLAYSDDAEIAAQFKPEAHTLPGTTAWCPNLA